MRFDKTTNLRRLGIVTAALIVMGAAAGCSSSGSSGASAAGAGGSCGASASKMTLHGSGQAQATPDLLTVVVSVDVTGATAKAALADNNARTTKLHQTFTFGGVAAKDVQTSGLTIEPQYAYPAGKPPRLTGYHVTDLFWFLKLTGRDGTRIAEVWRSGIESYLGMTVAGFPNMFLLVGPNSGLGHNSIVFVIEAQLRYIIRCLDLMDRNGAGTIEVRAEVQADHNRELREMMGAVRKVLQETPPELASDIIDNGIILTGGSSQLRNMPELVLRRTGVNAKLAQDAYFCVARGTGVALNHLSTYKKSIISKK